MPLGFGGSSCRISVDGYSPAPTKRCSSTTTASARALRTLGIRLLEGREFTDATHGHARRRRRSTRRWRGAISRAAIPIGGRIRIGTRTVEVVGVARDGKYIQITERPRA
jgi:hypothetical protein